ncbi:MULTISPECIES: hypothetical protein [Aerococcus]|uniref:DUF1510 domain-containing protein n=2 Tax=Aerococcus viridans TaxID=1377 RepID=A0AAU8UNS4_9LACT|nr:hypothetical protein [Aerococcus viridans]AMC01477.1 hypothetical protein AWM76_07885 [Aerococcus viridans]EFG49301.1 hypothetical protein HMPREF0061_1282 [Aerococcus viridans ATCC 11563 = CCUG 4311]MEC1385869.1 hypothetical protein [Aerococcus viridans]SPT62396.1 Uncharacterised protein [Aerococcus viridans]SUU15052.1 Uncharacterised protein [Aerococcus viridans]
MKRQTYRQAKKALEREKKNNQKKYGNPFSDDIKSSVPETTLTQDTAEFNVETFAETPVPKETFQDLDTNEIFFERQKQKQYFWSGSSNHSRKVLVWIILALAILAVVLLGPRVFEFFQMIFK